MRTLLVTGFGPFLHVADNPSGALAQSLDGVRIGSFRIVGLRLPVSYARAPAATLEAAWAHRAAAVVGFGVASTRPDVTVERHARRRCDLTHADVDGRRLRRLAPRGAPDRLDATVDVDAACAAMGAEPSDDAGGYVCNAWLYRALSALPGTPVGFVHVPAAGCDPERALRGLTAIVEGSRRWTR